MSYQQIIETQTAVADALVHAFQVLEDTGSWRVTADSLIDGVETRGYRIVRDDPNHYVNLTEDDRWFIEHSLDCRINGTIGTCKFNRAIMDLPEELRIPGRYRILGIVHGIPTLESVETPMVSRYFIVAPTGGMLPDTELTYLDTVFDGPFVWHIFECIQPFDATGAL
jgi:hypothetical protein